MRLLAFTRKDTAMKTLFPQPRVAAFVAVAAMALLVNAPAAHAGCPYDHALVGQQDGRLILDNWQLYRHCMVDYSAPYSNQYYEWADAGFFTRAEPGFAMITDPALALPGQPLVDYHLMIERVSASADLEFLNDNWQNILTQDGDQVSLSSVPGEHLHMRYVVNDEPDTARWITYRVVDAMGTYAPSAPFTVNFGAEPVPEPATMALLGLGVVGLVARRGRRR